MTLAATISKWVVVDLAGTNLRKSGSVAFKVVGYTTDMKWVIIDADLWGWQGLDMYDHVTEKCKTYWYLRLCEITKVL